MPWFGPRHRKLILLTDAGISVPIDPTSAVGGERYIFLAATTATTMNNEFRSPQTRAKLPGEPHEFEFSLGFSRGALSQDGFDLERLGVGSRE